jgi:dTDP-4-amino-4,6-dideoxygalactose transaminase
MTRLAIDGGSPAVKDTLAKFNTIGEFEIGMASSAMRSGPLSGYLGGERHGGLHVEALEEQWKDIFGVKHAVACNSATSGLLMAAVACGVGPGDDVITTPYTMSATAAAPAFLGANIKFADIEDQTFCLDPKATEDVIFDDFGPLKAIIATNLFGHPSDLKTTMEICDSGGVCLIEDNAQAFYAKEYGKYAGTIGHIGVFSLNVHKHLQCGEGGIVTTDDDALADRLKLVRNHGELAGGGISLNLRMVEPVAAIALAQLTKRDRIISERIEIAEEILSHMWTEMGIDPNRVRDGCIHSYYCVATNFGKNRDWIVDALVAEGAPMRKGYVEPLYRLPAFQKFARPCPVAERVNKSLALYENCAWTPTSAQLEQFKEAFKKVTDAYSRERDIEPTEPVSDSGDIGKPPWED